MKIFSVSQKRRKSETLSFPLFFYLSLSHFFLVKIVQKTAASDDDFSDDDFCILEEEEGSGIIPSSGEPTIRVLDAGGIRLENNYFAPPQVYLKLGANSVT